MRLLFIMVLGVVLMTSCNSTNKEQTQSNNQTSSHHFEVNEVLQTSGYTYLFVKEKGQEYWMAVSRMDVKVGDNFYFESGLEMLDFKSKELDRTFDRILFVDKISTVPILNNQHPAQTAPNTNPMAGKRKDVEKEKIVVESIEAGVTIAELYKNRAQYAGKKVLVKGHVVKVNNKIMGKNWIHLQDGTKDGKNFDLTLTTQEEVGLDQVVTFEGIVSINKDFGAGYSYELIIEEANLIPNNSI